MSPLALALALTLAQAPCSGERVVLLPLRPVVLSAAEARQVEETVRRAAGHLPGACLEARADTVARLRASGGLSGCADAACRGAQVRELHAGRLVRGVALGVGGARNVALTVVDHEGREAHATLELGGASAVDDEARALETLRGLWGEPVAAPARGWRPWPTVLWAAGGLALAAGVGFGLAARRTQTELSTGAGCPGEGAAFRDCVTQQLSQGRTRARTANTLWGAGAALGVGGTLLFVWETP
jgi:hypothetical protein